MNRHLRLMVLPCGLLASLDALPEGDNTRGAAVGKFCPLTHAPLDEAAVRAVAPHSFDPVQTANDLADMLEQVGSYEVIDIDAGPMDEADAIPVTVDDRKRHNDALGAIPPAPSDKPIDLTSQGV